MQSYLHEPFVVECYSNREDIIEKHQSNGAKHTAEELHGERHHGPPVSPLLGGLHSTGIIAGVQSLTVITAEKGQPRQLREHFNL